MKLKFLPPNTISKAQPLGKGIIQSFKVHYRVQLLEWLIMKPQACCFSKKDGFVTATILVQEDELPLSHLPVYDEDNFEDYVTMDNEFVTWVEPDLEVIFNKILSVTQYSEDSMVQEMDSEEDDDPSDDETEKYPTLKEDNVKHMMEQLKDFVIEKCPSMLKRCKQWKCFLQFSNGQKEDSYKNWIILSKMVKMCCTFSKK